MKRSLSSFAVALFAAVSMMYGQGTDLSKSSKTITTSSALPEPSGSRQLLAQNPSGSPVPMGSANVYGELNSQRPLKTGDTIDVQISKDLDLNDKVLVDRNGDVEIPYVGKVAVAGKTFPAAIETIQKKISDYFASNRVDFPDAALPAIPVNPPKKEITPAPLPPKTSPSPSSKKIVVPPPVLPASPVAVPAPAEPPVETKSLAPEPVKPAIPVISEVKPFPAQPPAVKQEAAVEPIPSFTPQPATAPVKFSPRKKNEKLDVDLLQQIVGMGESAEPPSSAPSALAPPTPPPAPVKVEVPATPTPPPAVEKIPPVETLPLRTADPSPSSTRASVLPETPAQQQRPAEIPAPKPQPVAPIAAPATPRMERPQNIEDKEAANELFKILENIASLKEAAATPAPQAQGNTSAIAIAPPKNGRLSVASLPPSSSPTETTLPSQPSSEPLSPRSPLPVRPALPVEESSLSENRLASEEIRRAIPTSQAPLSPEDFSLNTPTERLIQIGDLIDIKMPDEPDLNLQARVTREGRITLPYAGDVVIVGRTLGEATKLIKSRLAGYYVNPVVTLSVSEPAKGQFVILGQVERPGVYDIAGNTDTISLTEALAKASGTLRYGDIGKVTVKRTIAGQEQMATFDAKAMTQGAQNFNIMPGDTIIVRLSKNEFSILGEIRLPGLYSIPPMQDTVDLMEAIAMAGGAARFGDFGEIVIKRTKGNSEQILKVDAKALGRNESLQKVPIYAGDTIIVRLLRNEFVILGQVQRPGTYSIPPLQDSVDMLEALALSGGATRLANLNSITVRRTIDGKEVTLTVNMNQLVHGEKSERFPVLPGDRIVVSERMF